ncbi:hypothetical protein EZV73_02415 [Acidaminobacter sp. JC074]|uniref:aspartate/glutamate racemase family protein n=1 Tax=Acidaminobacter sp. JC074 TaxID=2530199 RepID=UPI001F0DD7AB|nr:aspartate/glutamate racemase family protein [Acidaminobacter sp. JC074]MCH4886400.1 hypothetical protein [Acidaminobacter sp. JC074]
MKILIINPNSSEAITKGIRKTAKQYENTDLVIDTINLSEAPLGIETYEDELIASFEVNKYLKNLDKSYKGVLIACFSDPGLMVVREYLKVPVIGIAEASLHMASLLGPSTSFVTSGGKEDIEIFDEISARYGLKDKVKAISYLGVGVNGVDESLLDTINKRIDTCLDQHGVSSVILGCGAFAGYGQMLNRHDIHVIDGIKEGIMMLKMMIDYSEVDSE